MRAPLRLGTRASALALAQAGQAADLLRAAADGREVELVEIRTGGDEGPGGPRLPPEDKARFVKELEEALLAGEIDLAVHSAKDIPAELPDGLAIVGVPERADPRDALCGARSLELLPEGAMIGTASLRRRAQLLAARPDLEIRELRGNVDTRLRKLADGDFAAIVLASAGLLRLGRPAEGAPLDELVPCAGQGCLALEGRVGDRAATDLAAAVTHVESLVRLTAERAVVTGLGATCDTPVGALATVSGEELTVRAFAGAADGSAWVRDGLTGPADDARGLGAQVAERMLRAGAAAFV